MFFSTVEHNSFKPIPSLTIDGMPNSNGNLSSRPHNLTAHYREGLQVEIQGSKSKICLVVLKGITRYKQGDSLDLLSMPLAFNFNPLPLMVFKQLAFCDGFQLAKSHGNFCNLY